MVGSFLIPTVVIVFCYAMIYVTFKRSSRRVKANAAVSSAQLNPGPVRLIYYEYK